MAEEGKRRIAKKTGAATHRTGTLRAAVKPGVKSASNPVQAQIEAFLLGSGSTLKHTYGADRLTRDAETLRAAFELAPSDELYLFSNLSSGSGAISGILLSESGFHLLDGNKGFANNSWSEFAKFDISAQGTTIVIGKVGISCPDAPALARLFKQIQTALAS